MFKLLSNEHHDDQAPQLPLALTVGFLWSQRSNMRHKESGMISTGWEDARI